MANIQGIKRGAGEGNRTPVTCLGSLSRGAFLPIFRKPYAAHWRNVTGFKAEHIGRLPHLYRAVEIGPASDCRRVQGLSRRNGGAHA